MRSIGKDHGVFRVTAPSTGPRGTRGHSFPRGGLLGGESRHREKEQEHCLYLDAVLEIPGAGRKDRNIVT